MILKPPAQNKFIQQVIDLYVPTLDEEEIIMQEERKKEHEEFFDLEIERFRTVITEAAGNGTKFLKIDKKWSDKEKRIFRIGLERYEGQELSIYCDLTGFSKTFIENAKFSELLTAARNVDTQIPQKPDSTIDYALLRKILMDVIT
jgi:hypothetical protein